MASTTTTLVTTGPEAFRPSRLQLCIARCSEQGTKPCQSVRAVATNQIPTDRKRNRPQEENPELSKN